jgi:predicted nuclease of predicted toxin-antitoxin system
MTIWIDAQLPPTLANWLTQTFNVEASSLRELGLRDVNRAIWAGWDCLVNQVSKESQPCR